jgi:hypothetical protein
LYLLLLHPLHICLCFVLVDPLWVLPQVLWDLFELDVHSLAHRPSNLVFEFATPLGIIQEYPWVRKMIIELFLHTSHAGDRALDFCIPSQHQQNSVGACGCVEHWVLTARVKGRVKRLGRARDSMIPHVDANF